MNSKVKATTTIYHLEPGDGTFYEFSITTPESPCQLHCASATSSLITIYIPNGQGAYNVFFPEDALSRHFVAYVHGHMPGIKSRYDVAAVLLACSSLVKNPDDLDAAKRRMLDAPDLL